MKWDPPAGMTNFNSHRYRLSIESANIGYTAEYSLPGDKATFVFSKLSDGEHFNVKVEYCVTPCKSDTEVICPIYNLYWEIFRISGKKSSPFRSWWTIIDFVDI